jgi:membrane protein implicated in regulation of membrane protease activity
VPDPADAPAVVSWKQMDFGVDVDVWPWVWLIVAIGFALIELTVLGGSFVLLPFAASAFAAAILAYYDVAIEVQWAVFLAGGALLFLVLARWARGFLKENQLTPGVGAERLVGRPGIVTVDIDPDDTNRRGRVSVDGEVWGALTTREHALPAGMKIRVAAMQGTRVVVEPLDVSAQGESAT